MDPMRLGVIDVGSNTVHLLAVDAHWGAHPIPASSHKIVLRLSEHVDDRGYIDDAARDELTKFVSDCAGIAEDQGIKELTGFATSAIREAPNGDDVLGHVAEHTGVTLEVVSGEEEARLTFLAARRWYGWSAGRLLLADIGGGSLELAIGTDENPDVAISLPLGAGRVTRDMLPGDPPDAAAVRDARREIRVALADHLRPIVKLGAADRFVATSKTMRSLARITGAAPSSEGMYAVRLLERSALAELVPRLAEMTAAERSALPGVSIGRAQQVLAGAMVAKATMDLLEIETFEVCPWALREGVILDLLDGIRR